MGFGVGRTALRVAALGVLAASLAGCVAFGDITPHVDEIDQSVGSSLNQAILLNIIRASRNEPLYFTSISQVSGSGNADLKTGLPNIVLGAPSPNTLGASRSRRLPAANSPRRRESARRRGQAHAAGIALVEPADGGVAGGARRVARGRERGNLRPQTMLHDFTVVADPRNQHARQKPALRRRVGPATESIAVLVDELEGLFHSQTFVQRVGLVQPVAMF